MAGGLLLEAVVASLTSAQRSASSLTNIGAGHIALDAAVDKILDAAFDNSEVDHILRSSECNDDSAAYGDLL